MSSFSEKTEIIETTVGELVEALTQAAAESARDELEGYTLATVALSELVDQQQLQQAFN